MGCDLYGCEPGKISGGVALRGMTGSAGLLKSVRMHGSLRVILGADVVTGVAVEAFGAAFYCSRTMLIDLVMAVIAVYRSRTGHLMMVLVYHIDMALLTGDLAAVNRFVELLHGHFEHRSLSVFVVAPYTIQIGVGNSVQCRK